MNLTVAALLVSYAAAFSTAASLLTETNPSEGLRCVEDLLAMTPGGWGREDISTAIAFVLGAVRGPHGKKSHDLTRELLGRAEDAGELLGEVVSKQEDAIAVTLLLDLSRGVLREEEDEVVFEIVEPFLKEMGRCRFEEDLLERQEVYSSVAKLVRFRRATRGTEFGTDVLEAFRERLDSVLRRWEGGDEGPEDSFRLHLLLHALEEATQVDPRNNY